MLGELEDLEQHLLTRRRSSFPAERSDIFSISSSEHGGEVSDHPVQHWLDLGEGPCLRRTWYQNVSAKNKAYTFINEIGSVASKRAHLHSVSNRA
jgi:hypothetical protein